MKLQVLQENLSRALNITSRFVSPRAQLPVLANILLSANKNKLSVSSTNLETSINLSIGAKVEKKGEITAPARAITELVANLAKGTLTIEAKKELLKIQTPGFTSSVSGMNPADFPSVPQSVGKKPQVLPKDTFSGALSSVLFAASVDETRPVLTGVLFIFGPKKLQLVATDGFRLSQKKITLKSSNLEKIERIILPKNTLSELLRLTSEEDEIKFSLSAVDNQVVFGVGSATLTSRVIEGEFPDYEAIVPKNSLIKIRLDKEEFLRSVKLASVFARDSANVTKLRVKKGSILLSAESQQLGEQETQVDAKVEGDVGKGFEIAFNYRFLEDFLNSVSGEEIQVELTNAKSPAVFTDPKDSDFLHLIMPVRIQG